MATSAQTTKFLKQVIPMFQKYGKKYSFHIISFAIAQACYESGYGTSYAAKNYNNILGIGPHKKYSSWDACVQGYYTDTVLGRSSAARKATTLDEYFSAFVASNYCPGTERTYYATVKSIINSYGLKKYDAKKGQSLTGVENNPLQKFLDIAYKHSNKESFSAWVKKKLNLTGNPDWCGYFVSACAKEAGVLNKVIAYDGWVTGIMTRTVNECGGTRHKSSNYTPQPGDLVSEKYPGEQRAHHVSIVGSVDGKKFVTYDGNHTDRLSNRVNRSLSDSVIYEFVHPDWESVGGYSTGASSSSSASSSSYSGQLYDSEYSRDDALLREVAYINSKSERTTKKSDIHLSVINYTSMLSDLWRMLGTHTETNDDATSNTDTSKLSGNAKTTIDFLIQKGLNAAAACGVAGNVYYESGFNTASIGDNGTSFGICQWHNARGTAMKKYVGKNWKENLSGQLNYLWYDLTKNYTGVYTYIKKVANTSAGAKDAADYFVRHFEVPANVDEESTRRQAKAAAYFSDIKTNGTVKDGSLTNKQKKVLNATNDVASPGANLCASWVNRVFGKTSIGNLGGDARDLYKKYCRYKDKAKLKPGMIIAVDSWGTGFMSRTYGHVGIYMGNDKVKDNIGSIHESKLDNWISYYQTWPKTHPVKWGWYGNVDLTK